MSQQTKQRLQRLLRLLEQHDCDLSVEWLNNRAHFWNKKEDVELSEWMAPTKALAWAQGYLIGTGHKWAKEMKI